MYISPLGLHGHVISKLIAMIFEQLQTRSTQIMFSSLMVIDRTIRTVLLSSQLLGLYLYLKSGPAHDVISPVLIKVVLIYHKTHDPTTHAGTDMSRLGSGWVSKLYRISRPFVLYNH